MSPGQDSRYARTAVTLAACFQLAACAAGHIPANNGKDLFASEVASEGTSYPGQQGGESSSVGLQAACPAPGVPNFYMASAPANFPQLRDRRMRYSPGDRFNLSVPGFEDFSGDFVINADSSVFLPFSGEINGNGLTNDELRAKIEKAFIRAGMFVSEGAGKALRLTVRPVQYAPVNINVSGAVFQPGRTVINNIKDADKTEKFLTRFGDAPLDRFVPSALKASGGVRPDADVANILLVRRGRTYRLDWRGAFTGEKVDDVPLVEGDSLIVSTTGCFQSGLVRVSQITPPGIRIFASNLIVPSLSNANAAVGQFSTSVPYGTRLLQALVSANCVGGSLASNAPRHAVLISRNPSTLKTEVTQRAIEELVLSADRDTINPFLMPDDAIACYDSAVTDIKEAASALSAIASTPLSVKTLTK